MGFEHSIRGRDRELVGSGLRLGIGFGLGIGLRFGLRIGFGVVIGIRSGWGSGSSHLTRHLLPLPCRLFGGMITLYELATEVFEIDQPL